MPNIFCRCWTSSDSGKCKMDSMRLWLYRQRDPTSGPANRKLVSQQSLSRYTMLLAFDMCLWIGGSYVAGYNGTTPHLNKSA